LIRAAAFFPQPTGFFFHPGKIPLEPIGFLLYGFFFTQRNLGGFTKLGATGKLHAGFFGGHLSKCLALPNNRILNFYSLEEI
jgi:hypothetical protein